MKIQNFNDPIFNPPFVPYTYMVSELTHQKLQSDEAIKLLKPRFGLVNLSCFWLIGHSVSSATIFSTGDDKEYFVLIKKNRKNQKKTFACFVDFKVKKS